MLTPDMSDTGWLVLAVLSGLAFGVALATMGETWGKRLALLVLPPFAGAAVAFGQSLARGDSSREASYLYILATLGITITRLVYTPWIRRQASLRRAGEPVDEVRPWQPWLVIVTLVASVVGVALLVH